MEKYRKKGNFRNQNFLNNYPTLLFSQVTMPVPVFVAKLCHVITFVPYASGKF